jgi:hypothetical protein
VKEESCDFSQQRVQQVTRLPGEGRPGTDESVRKSCAWCHRAVTQYSRGRSRRIVSSRPAWAPSETLSQKHGRGREGRAGEGRKEGGREEGGKKEVEEGKRGRKRGKRKKEREGKGGEGREGERRERERGQMENTGSESPKKKSNLV